MTHMREKLESLKWYRLGHKGGHKMKTKTQQKRLTNREQQFISLRFKPNGEIKNRLTKVANIMNVTRQRAHALQVQVLNKKNVKLKTYFYKEPIK